MAIETWHLLEFVICYYTLLFCRSFVSNAILVPHRINPFMNCASSVVLLVRSDSIEWSGRRKSLNNNDNTAQQSTRTGDNQIYLSTYIYNHFNSIDSLNWHIMYLTRSEYDRGVNTFSPEGRLFQVCVPDGRDEEHIFDNGVSPVVMSFVFFRLVFD